MQPPAMQDDETRPPLDPQSVREAFNIAQDNAHKAQEAHLDASQHAGYARAAIAAMAPFYIRAAELAEDTPTIVPILASGVNLISAIGDELGQAASLVAPIAEKLHAISGSINTLVTSTGTAASVLIPGTVDLEPFEAPAFFAPDEDKVYSNLQAIDPPLALTYKEVGQAFHGTTADPSRAAIALMRQTLDHFFAKIAPDDDVRLSPYWHQKPGDDPMQITRRERMTYAAYVRVKDPARAKSLVGTIDVILEAYQFLNQLHRRGALSEKQANRALRTTKTFIETWIDAIGAQPRSPA